MFRLALTNWQAREWLLLSMSDKDFSAWLASQPPDIIGSDPWLTGDPVIDSWARESAEDLANGGDGVPASWKTEEALWQDRKIAQSLKPLFRSTQGQPRPKPRP